ncbi:BTAD domain-containing putative transcriptional regulator [Nonomuraea muscovyensis]
MPHATDEPPRRAAAMTAWDEAADVPRFRLLGPLEIVSGGGPARITAHKQRTILAMLLAHAGDAVSLPLLVDEVWDGRPPPSAVSNLRTYVMQLRRSLPAPADPPGDRLVTSPSGYLLRLAPGELDLRRFQALVGTARQARSAGDLGGAERAYADALALWRGDAAEDVRLGPTLRSVVAHLDEQRLTAVEDHVEVLLALGRHAEVVERLRLLAVRHPLRERVHGGLMLALYRCGDTAGALETYGHARRLLADELGMDPGPELRRLHEAMLRRDRDLLLPAAGREPTAHQLPLDAHGFTGRDRELAGLDALLGDGPPVIVLSGTAGVGKTALAVHWAHLVRDRFPDGQLHANLRGFDAGGSVPPPSETLRAFLEALGVPADRVPAAFEARLGLYRGLLADRRVLVLLDNARDADQVRPLLPGSPTCLVLLTSRNRLTGLVAAEGARPLTVDPLPTPQARELLTRRLGPDRAAAEPEAVEEIIARCARLPLALVVAAARAVTEPGLPLAGVAAELGEPLGCLDALGTGDPATDVRTVFSSSYRALGAESARLFRTLGLHPGPEISVAAAAGMAGLPVRRVRPLLAELTWSHLLTEPRAGRYVLHDLLWAYAGELAHAHADDAERRAVAHRMLDHYLHSADAAASALEPRRASITTTPPRPGVRPETFAGEREAMEWFAAEQAVLLACVGHAAAHGFPRHSWRIASALTAFHDRQGRWPDLVAALYTAERVVNDLPARAHLHRLLGHIHHSLGDLQRSVTCYRHSLDLFRRDGDRFQEAGALVRLGESHYAVGDRYLARGAWQQALRILERHGHPGAGPLRARLRAVHGTYEPVGTPASRRFPPC